MYFKKQAKHQCCIPLHKHSHNLTFNCISGRYIKRKVVGVCNSYFEL